MINNIQPGLMVASRKYNDNGIMLGMIIAHEKAHPYCWIIEWYAKNGPFELPYNDDAASTHIKAYHQYKTSLGL